VDCRYARQNDRAGAAENFSMAKTAIMKDVLRYDARFARLRAVFPIRKKIAHPVLRRRIDFSNND
jgi:hypothetical protein